MAKEYELPDVAKLARTVYSTEAGKELIDFLKTAHGTQSAVRAEAHFTMYEMGRKELVLELWDLATSEPDADETVELITD